MPFFTYDQNNSGGSFTGPANYVIVEADTATEADAIFETIEGCYFDDDYEYDCDCCGTRWSRAWGAGDPTPMVYDSPVEDGFHRAGVLGAEYVKIVRKDGV